MAHSPPALGAPRGASFTARPALRPATSCSYRIAAGAAEQIAAHLAARGWRAERPRSEHERARLRHPEGAIVVLYERSILAQGARPELAHSALAELVEGGRP